MKLHYKLFTQFLQFSILQRAAIIFTVALFTALTTWTLYPSISSITPLVSAESLSTTVGTKLTTASRSSAEDTESTTAAIGLTPGCVPVSNASPTPLALSDMPTTLKQQIDAPTRYRIYGDDSSSMRTHIRTCGPVTAGTNEVEYAAVTQYQLTWQYQYTNDSGICTITNASVGIHVSQALPLWQPSSSTPDAFANKWAAFDTALANHEDGHTAIDVEYAQKLLTDLNQLPPTSCNQLTQSVKQLTDGVVSELEQANESYDSRTNHGATQGAILP